jgi:hypothetical protein
MRLKNIFFLFVLILTSCGSGGSTTVSIKVSGDIERSFNPSIARAALLAGVNTGAPEKFALSFIAGTGPAHGVMFIFPKDTQPGTYPIVSKEQEG